MMHVTVATNPRRHLRLWGGLSLPVVALFVVAGCQKPAASPPPPKPPEVVIAHPVTEDVTDYEEYTGRMAPVKIVDLRARVSGYLDEVQFIDGTDVDADAPLFRIDRRPFVAAFDQAEANVVQTDARLERARRQEARLTKLSEQKVTTIEDFEQSKYDRMEAEGALQAAKAARDLAKLNLEFTEITAPFAGRISRRLVDPGNLIRADETPLATLVSLDPVYAYFDVDERTVLQVRRLIAEGKMTSARDRAIEVELALADESDFTLKGQVNFVDNQVSATTGTLRLRAEVDNPRKLLAPGMFVRVKVPIGVPRTAVLVPEESLGSDQGQRFVYTLNDKDEVQYRRVKTGRLSHGLRVVNEGLETSDRVIVTGLQRVRPGVQVAPKVKELDPSASVQQAGGPSLPPVLVAPPPQAIGHANTIPESAN
jgi:RND family efflux transporter MFP subunit